MNFLLVASVKLVTVNVGVAPLTTDWFNALTSAIDVNSESIKAPAAVTFDVFAVNLASLAVTLVENEALAALIEPEIVAAVNPFIKARDVTSESIKAPAAVTFVASVTSADASIASNLFFNVVVKLLSVSPLIPVIPEPSPENPPEAVT